VTEERSGAQILVESLVRQGVEFVFGYPGGAVLPIYDALFDDERLRHILVRHEAGAAHAAEGYARSTGKPGVVLVTSRPRRDQCGHGHCGCFPRSDPAGGHHRPGRHAADRLGRVSGSRYRRHHAPLLQAQLSGEGPGDLAKVIDEAFQIATTGRPGPVVIDIPKDVQIATAHSPKARCSAATATARLAGGEAKSRRPSSCSPTPRPRFSTPAAA
jgi:acetolactate synthase-1/2/3 large subunit